MRTTLLRGGQGSQQPEQAKLESFGIPVNKGAQGLRGGLGRDEGRGLGLFGQGGGSYSQV